MPSIAKYLNTRFSVLVNLGFIAAAALIGLAALIPAWPIYGVIPAMFLMTTMGFLGFTISRVLHQTADSSKRATLLSVKGLVFNLGYGLFSLGFSGFLASFPNTPAGVALRAALFWQVPLFALMVVGLLIWAKVYLRPKH